MTPPPRSPRQDAVYADLAATRAQVAEYWREVAADPERSAFAADCLAMLARGADDGPPDLGLAPYRLGVAGLVLGNEEVQE